MDKHYLTPLFQPDTVAVFAGNHEDPASQIPHARTLCAALTGQRLQGRINQQFLITVGLTGRGINQPRPFAQDNILAAAESHITDLRTDGEDPIGFRVVRHHSCMMPSAAVPCDAWCDRVIACPNGAARTVTGTGEQRAPALSRAYPVP